MRVVAIHDLGDLERDLRALAKRVPRSMGKVVHRNARAGALIARASAKRTAGKHGKHYHMAITWDRSAKAYYGFGGGTIQAEYGADTARPQGRMSFEWGSRNQPPHLDHAKSAIAIAPKFVRDVHDEVGTWFW